MWNEEIIKAYFELWFSKDGNKLADIFANDALYYEYYGPVYKGVQQIQTWFNEWNKFGTVLKWDISRVITQDNIAIAEWHFKCEYNNEIDEFDGVSIVEFNDDRKIISLKEFHAKAERCYPYGE